MSFPRKRESRDFEVLFSKIYKNLFCLHVGSKRNGTLYIGVTNNLIRRVYQHKKGIVPGFTNKYGAHKLVYYEQVDDIRSAIEREKQLKKWSRRWKLELIESANPYWRDLYDELYDPGLPLPAFVGTGFAGASLHENDSWEKAGASAGRRELFSSIPYRFLLFAFH